VSGLAVRALTSPQPAGKPSIGDADRAEEEGKSELGKWKWVLLVVAVVIVLYILTQLSTFECTFLNPAVGGPTTSC
jgi:hypothetical protein